ncbi:MAG: hypothetical protein D6767_00080 [Candidatus Hydrogenedentota bacterium]|nr:MAG: hypothetical protein D6767_00080 [Candidatus Hydrogenedentota bacterium]
MRILADEMERFLAKEESHFEGNVVISREKLNVYADEGTLYEKENRVRLIGNVRIFFGENIYSANKAMLYRGGEKIVLEDDVKLILLTNGKSDVVAYGHRADFYPEQEKKGKVIRPQKVYLYASGQQMAQVYYESGWIEAEQVFAQGVHFKFIEAFHQVFFESEKDSVAGFCEKLRRDGEIVFVWGNKNKRPLLYQYENTLLKIAMLAHEIEYRENEEVAFGRGSAQVRIYPKNTYIPKQYLDFLVLPARSDIFGQWAKYELNLDFLTMSGDVRIQEKNSLLRAQSLQMHTKSNRIRFVGNLNGSFKFASTENR